MNVKEKILKMESCRGHNHDLRNFRNWMNEFMPNHTKLKKIQVAGTNGKGSTCQWLHDVLVNSGYKVGLFTSPHLVSHMERIKINNQNISYEDWERIYDQYVNVFEDKKLTMFEMDLWMAIAYFLEQDVDVAIVEVGMGGREDATTALDYMATVITNIGMDHIQYLGDSIEQITYEKAGIFKPGVLALTTETKENSRKVMSLIADYINAPLGFVEMSYKEVNGKYEIEWNEDTYFVNPPSYQVSNLALALETLNCLGFILKKDVVQKTIDEFEWRGRFTILSQSPMIIIDGAHNTHGIESLMKSLPKWHGHLYFSALKEKNVLEMIRMLETYHCPITLVSIESERMYNLQELKYPLITCDELITKIKKKEEDMLLCGSLYFVGEVLEKLYG